MPEILEGLTDAQREAVAHINGPLLVIAGPGSGKTRVITRRIAHLLYCGIRPWDILAITFTNKAAGEMRARVEALTSQKGLVLSTFHAFGARVLREFAERLGYKRDFTIYDADDSRRAIGESMKALEISKDVIQPKVVQSAISSFKEKFIAPEDVPADATDLGALLVRRIYAAYAERLAAANAMDFDDLLMKTALLLRTDAHALERLRGRHKFILVDEFQDTSRSQYIIARLLAEEHRNLCVTGDPDQSIYGWRGAEISNILDFERDFPETKTVFLDRNYRSTKVILAAANSVVEQNVERKPRELYTQNAEGEKILLCECSDSAEEAETICRKAAALIEGGAAAKDIAVFYRVNSLSRRIEEAFVRAGVPYQMVAGTEFYGRKEVKDVLAYLRLATNPADEASFARAIAVPSRGIGPKAIEQLKSLAAGRGETLVAAAQSEEVRAGFSTRAASGLRAFADAVASIASAGEGGARAAVETALGASGYRAMLEASRDKADKDRLENLAELVNAAAEYDEQVPDGLLPGFLERTVLAGDVDSWKDAEDKVTLMTMHAAKGLEFPSVIIAGLDEGILPHSRSREGQRELEEERRVFFVALTRAKERLFLFRADRRMVNGAWQYGVASRFLREIPAELLEYDGGTQPLLTGSSYSRTAYAAGPGASWRGRPEQERRAAASRESEVSSATRVDSAAAAGLPGVGAKVRHAVFGVGVVRSVTASSVGHKAVVSFRMAGDKKVILEKAGLEAVE